MRKYIKKNKSLFVGVVASIIASLLMTSIKYFVSKLTFLTDEMLVYFIASMIGFMILWFSVKYKVLNIYEILGVKYLSNSTGITKVYPTLEDAYEDLKSSFLNAKTISLMLHIGRREFGIKDSLYYEILKKRVDSDDEIDVRILHIHPESDYVSRKRAEELGKPHFKWIQDIEYVRNQIEEASSESERVRICCHNEPFLWRLFIFDNVMFVSAYLHKSKNDKKAPVYKIEEQNNNSLYAAFRNYYNFLWLDYTKKEVKEQYLSKAV